jgi:hypothetical protein
MGDRMTDGKTTLEIRSHCRGNSPARFARTRSATARPAPHAHRSGSNSHSCNTGNQLGTSFISVKRAGGRSG